MQCIRSLLRQALNETGNFGVSVDHVIEFLGEIIADLLDKGEDVIANLVFAVLLLAEHCESGENDAFEELEKNFVALAIDEVDGFKNIFVLHVVLAQR